MRTYYGHNRRKLPSRTQMHNFRTKTHSHTHTTKITAMCNACALNFQYVPNVCDVLRLRVHCAKCVGNVGSYGIYSFVLCAVQHTEFFNIRPNGQILMCFGPSSVPCRTHNSNHAKKFRKWYDDAGAWNIFSISYYYVLWHDVFECFWATVWVASNNNIFSITEKGSCAVINNTEYMIQIAFASDNRCLFVRCAGRAWLEFFDLPIQLVCVSLGMVIVNHVAQPMASMYYTI